MKKLATITIIIIFFTQSAYPFLYCPPDEWYIEGPGGSYGVVSCHSQWSVVLLGPIHFTVGFGFDAIDEWSRTALYCAIADNRSFSYIKYLVDKGANLNTLNCGDESPLDIAKTAEVRNLLLKNGAKTGETIKKEKSQRIRIDCFPKDESRP